MRENGLAVDTSKANDGIKAREDHGPSPHEGNTRNSETRSVRGTKETKEYPTGLKSWLINLTITALLIPGGPDTNIVATTVPRYGVKFQYDVQCSWK
jgi:hypothetical protein